jgi:lysophospholipase L1-like esterase
MDRVRRVTVRFPFHRLAPAVALAAWATFAVAADDPPKLELRDGDRVVFVGDGFFEYDHERGYLETELTARYPDRDIRFRNLGRTGDTVWGDAWAGFDTAVQGFDRRRDLVLSLDPTVILISCGMNESFEGEAGLPRFVEGLNKMLDGFAPAKARIGIVAPITHEKLPSPLPDPAKHNAELRRYRTAMATIATLRGAAFIDPSDYQIGGDGANDFGHTSDGIHLNPYGYWYAAPLLTLNINGPEGRTWEADIVDEEDEPKVVRSAGVEITELERRGSGIRFHTLEDCLPLTPCPQIPQTTFILDHYLSVNGLKLGRYTLVIDGKSFAEAVVDSGRLAMRIEDCPERRQAEELRKAIVAKNRLLYYRLRPQNETYIYGFRKHEQGQNAAEVPKFDPLVAEKEEEIAKLRVPKPHVYEIVREEGE